MTDAVCEYCGAPQVVIVNGHAACLAHVDDVFRDVVRSIAIARGIEPELAERRAVELWDEAMDEARRYRDD